MTILNVPDIHCNKCIERITQALTEEKIVFNANLQSKTVGVNGPKETVEKAISILGDLGFDASIIQE